MCPIRYEQIRAQAQSQVYFFNRLLKISLNTPAREEWSRKKLNFYEKLRRLHYLVRDRWYVTIRAEQSLKMVEQIYLLKEELRGMRDEIQ